VLERDWLIRLPSVEEDQEADASTGGDRVVLEIPFVVQVTNPTNSLQAIRNNGNDEGKKDQQNIGASVSLQFESELVVDTLESSLRHNATSVSLGDNSLQDLFSTTFASGAFGINRSLSTLVPVTIIQPLSLVIDMKATPQFNVFIYSANLTNTHPKSAVFVYSIDVLLPEKVGGITYRTLEPLQFPFTLFPGEQMNQVGFLRVTPRYQSDLDEQDVPRPKSLLLPTRVFWGDAREVRIFEMRTASRVPSPDLTTGVGLDRRRGREMDDASGMVRLDVERADGGMRVRVTNLASHLRCLELVWCNTATLGLSPGQRQIRVREMGAEGTQGVGVSYDDGARDSKVNKALQQTIPIGWLESNEVWEQIVRTY